MGKTTGGFTLPGESGYEELTLEMAKKWGADVIRDSDGTELSPEIINAGYGIYSTICIIRDHNEWAKQNMDKLQQTFLMTDPVVATDSTVTIDLMKDFFADQFKLNDSDEAKEYWQVFDRTSNEEIKDWTYADGKVTVNNVTPWHKYTVNFLAWRIWEEISMYNQMKEGSLDPSLKVKIIEKEYGTVEKTYDESVQDAKHHFKWTNILKV